MFKPKFTAGPWNVDTWTGTLKGINSKDPHKVTHYSVWRDDLLICTTGLIDDERAKHNANLIAVSPEMYAALNEINNLIFASMGSILDRDRYFKIRELCCNCLHKANGEQIEAEINPDEDY